MGEILTGIMKKREHAAEMRGAKENGRRAASLLLNTGMSLEEIAHASNLTLEEVKKIRDKRPA